MEQSRTPFTCEPTAPPIEFHESLYPNINLPSFSEKDIQPASQEIMSNFMDKEIKYETDNNYVKLESENLKAFLDFLKSQNNYTDFVYFGKAESEEITNATNVATTVTNTLKPISLEESWVLVNHSEEADEFVRLNPNLQIRPSIFSNWPSFGVYDKMSVVCKASGAAFCFGYIMGAKAALNSLYSFADRPVQAAGFSAATMFAIYAAPRMALKAVQYIIVGGVLGGTAMASPIFVMGTSGIFVATTVYHSFILTKRLAVKAVGY